MNKLVLNGISYIIEIDNTSDEVCDKCALQDLNRGCTGPCDFFDCHMKKTTEGSCYFVKDVEKTEETTPDKKIEVAQKLYDVLDPLESCINDCPLMDVCEPTNTICNKLEKIVNK